VALDKHPTPAGECLRSTGTTATETERFLGIVAVPLAKLRGALEHNLRHALCGAYVGAGINPGLTHTNEVVAGLHSPQEAFDEAQRAMAGLRIPKRADAFGARELVLRPVEGFPDRGGDLWRAFVAWGGEHAGGHVLSAVIHRDQSGTHCHLLLLPIVAGKWVGSRLLANYPKAFDSFDATVGAEFGISSRGSAAGPDSPTVVAALEELDRVHSDSVHLQAAIRAAVKAAPLVFLAALGKLPAKRVTTKSSKRPGARKPKTMAAIFTGTGRKTSEDKARKSAQRWAGGATATQDSSRTFSDHPGGGATAAASAPMVTAGASEVASAIDVVIRYGFAATPATPRHAPCAGRVASAHQLLPSGHTFARSRWCWGGQRTGRNPLAAPAHTNCYSS
jgi:hypothetical protein